MRKSINTRVLQVDVLELLQLQFLFFSLPTMHNLLCDFTNVNILI